MNDMTTPEENLLRLPPQAVEAEAGLIASMMVNPIAVEDSSESLTDSDFYNIQHAQIFSSIMALFSDQVTVDVITVSEKLAGGDSGIGLSYLGAISSSNPNSGNHKAYIRIIKEKSMVRNFIESCNEHIEKAYDNEKSHELANSLSNHLESLDSSEKNSFGLTLEQISKGAIDEMDRLFKADSDLIGFDTGLSELNKLTSGMCRGDLVIVGARPAMGKTAFAQKLIKKTLVDGGVAEFFSMEMPASQLYNRIWSEQSGVPLGCIRQPKTMETDYWPRITAARSVVNDRNLIIDDQAGLNINQIRARSRKTKRRFGSLDIVVIDYLQLMTRSGVGSTAEQIGEITRALKNMAKDLDCAVVCLSQLNRSVESRPDKRPVMSDLRDSGSVEADADLIMLLYRDEVYNPNTEYKGICEIGLVKQRNGEIGIVRSIFEGQFQRFRDFASTYQNRS